MVKENTHLLGAQRILDRLSGTPVGELIASAPDAYFLGALLPDTLYYTLPTERLADMLHGHHGAKSSDIVFRMLEKYRKTCKMSDLAMILGYLTHCAFDVVFHPMIYQHSKGMYAHVHIETWIDRRLVKRPLIAKLIKPRLIVGSEFAHQLFELVGVNEETLLKGLKRQATAERYYRNRLVYWVIAVLARIGLVRPAAVALLYNNLYWDKRRLRRRLLFFDPLSNKEVRASIEEQFDRAVEYGIVLVRAAFQYADGKISRKACERFIDGRNLNTSLKPGQKGHDTIVWGAQLVNRRKHRARRRAARRAKGRVKRLKKQKID